jgi:hypothetical protein
MIRSVTVYLSARDAVHRDYFTAAEAMGRGIAASGWALVYGGNNIGLMRAVADGCRAAGGRVIGITPQLMVDEGIHDANCELTVTQTMRERKALLESRGDAFVILPGGIGTFEELFEVLVGRQLGYHSKPIVFLNTNNYYDPLLAMIEHGIEHAFIRPASRELYHVSDSVADVIDYLQAYYPLPTPADIKVAAE